MTDGSPLLGQNLESQGLNLRNNPMIRDRNYEALLFSALLSGMQELACFLKSSKMVIYYKLPHYFVMRGHCYIFYYICSLCGF